LRTAKADVEDEELRAVAALDELDVRPVVEAPPVPAELAGAVLEAPAEVEALLVPAPETLSPTSPESETIVPLVGA
jgi:hypothetical protein